MYAVTHFMPTGSLSTLIRGLALAAIVVVVILAAAAVAPVIWAGCCSLALAAVGVVCNAAVVAVTMAVPFAIMKVM